MSNYTKATNFTAKDTLPSGDSGKIVKGTEIDVELTAVSSAIASKADINSPTFTGTPAAPTAAAGTATTQIATTAFVVTNERAATATLTNKTINGSNNTITNVSLATGVTGTLPVANGGTGVTTSTGTGNVVLSASPTLTGNPIAPTQSAGNSSDRIATTSFVGTAVSTSAALKADKTTTITAGTGLSGGGDLSANRTISLANTAVTAGTYGSSSAVPRITINSQGQITSATTQSITIPTFSHSDLSTSLSDGTSYTLPSDAVFIQGTGYFQMNGSTGSRMDVQIKNSSGTTIDTYILGGGNELNGTDGGSGMGVRDSFTILLPPTARSVTFVKGAGASSFSGQLEAVLSFTGYHS